MPTQDYWLQDSATWRRRGGVRTPGTPPPPPPPPSGGGRWIPDSTIFGSSSGPPSAERVDPARVPNPDNMSPELDAYRGKTRSQLFDYFQSEYAAKAGITQSAANPLMRLWHNYDQSMVSSVNNSQIAPFLTKNVHGLVSHKSGGRGRIAAGTHDAAIVSFTKSYTDPDFNLYFAVDHEPSNDGPNQTAWTASDAQKWRNDQARFAKLILDNRGDRRVIPTIQAINFDIKGDNNGLAEWHNCAPEMEALGVDLDQVVFSVDGYDTSPIKSGGARNLYSTSTITRGWGFKRYAVSEGACKSYAAADKAFADNWIAELANVCRDLDIEYFAWFASGVGGRANQLPDVNEGWWLYSDAVKAAFARMCKGLI